MIKSKRPGHSIYSNDSRDDEWPEFELSGVKFVINPKWILRKFQEEAQGASVHIGQANAGVEMPEESDFEKAWRKAQEH